MSRPQKYTKQDSIDALQRATEEAGQSPTISQYREVIEDGPSVGTVRRHFGSWNEAKDELDLVQHDGRMMKEVDFSYFRTIETTEKAYWLGFLYGDGSLQKKSDGNYKLQVQLGNKDKHHLGKFKKAINSEHKIAEYEAGNVCNIQIANRKFVEPLLDFGMTPDKMRSSTVPHLGGEERLRAAFIRGLADADGRYTQSRFTITGSSEKRFEKLQDWLPVDSRIEDYSVFRLTVTGAEELVELYNWLFPEGKSTAPSLERKVPKL